MKKNASSLLCALAIAGCTSTPPVRLVETQCPELSPPPADVMVKREPNFLERLLSFLSASPAKPTP